MPITLTNVHWIPDQPHNLISYSRMEDAGFRWSPENRTMKHGIHTFHHDRDGGTFPWSEPDDSYEFSDSSTPGWPSDDSYVAKTAAARPTVPRDTADWQILLPTFDDVMSPFTPTGEPRAHWFELFRKPGNEVCAKGHSLTDSAFNHSWQGRDNYGNPVFEERFLDRTFDKALNDFAKSPDDTRFVFIVPKWPTAQWWQYVKHFEVVREFPTGNMLLSCAPVGDTRGLTP